MTATAFCESCGERVDLDSRFCAHCGAAMPEVAEHRRAAEDSDASAHGGGAWQGFDARQAAERLEALTPGASELASQLWSQFKAPAVAASLIAGSLAAATVFAIGIVLGLVFSHASLLGLVDYEKGFLTSAFAQMLNFSQVGYSGIGKLGPALFLVFPIGACAVASAAQARGTEELPPLVRLASGAGTGVVFGLLMLVPALATGGLGGNGGPVDPEAFGAVLLGMLWGATGGVLGVHLAIRRTLPPRFLRRLLPARAAEIARTIYVALRPLVVLLAVMTIAGTAVWTIETLAKSDIRAGRSTLVATVDDIAYGLEHGLHWTELGGLAQFHATPVGGGVAASGEALAFPVPVGRPAQVAMSTKGEYRLFGVDGAMAAYTFIPLVIFLIVVPLLFALYAGFAIARLRAARTPWVAAAWGCLVGPIWAVALVIVDALVTKSEFGAAVGTSVFGMFLLDGLVIGALGGFLSFQSAGGASRFDPDSGMLQRDMMPLQTR